MAPIPSARAVCDDQRPATIPTRGLSARDFLTAEAAKLRDWINLVSECHGLALLIHDHIDIEQGDSLELQRIGARREKLRSTIGRRRGAAASRKWDRDFPYSSWRAFRNGLR